MVSNENKTETLLNLFGGAGYIVGNGLSGLDMVLTDVEEDPATFAKSAGMGIGDAEAFLADARAYWCEQNAAIRKAAAEKEAAALRSMKDAIRADCPPAISAAYIAALDNGSKSYPETPHQWVKRVWSKAGWTQDQAVKAVLLLGGLDDSIAMSDGDKAYQIEILLGFRRSDDPTDAVSGWGNAYA